MNKIVPLLELSRLSVSYPASGGLLRRKSGQVLAVDGVSLTVNEGESLGLVGESGCGKSTLAKSIFGLVPKQAGSVTFSGVDLHSLPKRELQRLRPQLQLIFQDPSQSLNPARKLGDIVGEALLQHRLCPRSEVRDRVRDMFRICGLAPEYMDSYPHECSGGQRQRAGIARALAVDPRLVVADEPLASLDVSIQAQMIHLFQELQSSKRLSYLFISHDLNAVAYLCSKIAVMYLGTIVEVAPTDRLYETPLHPYTQALLAAIPVADPLLRKPRILLKGDPPSPTQPPSGCKFHTRCALAKDVCKQQIPPLRSAGPGHQVACHLVSS